MTDYPNRSAGWKKRQVQAKWQNLIAIFITVVLLLAVFNGVLRGFSLERSLGKSSWTRGSSLLIAVNSSAGSLLVYQDNPKRLALLTFDEEDYFATGDADAPIEKLAKVFELNDVSDKLSGAVHLPVGHFLIFDARPVASAENFKDYFKNFAAITTPFQILLNFQNNNTMRTNLTRGDLFRLWWGLKSIRQEALILEDLGDLTSETILVNNQKIEVIDAQAVAKVVGKYLENEKVSDESFSITIKNASGVNGAGQLASDLITAAGVHVVKVETDPETSDASQILTGDGNSFTAAYLANVVGCDIKTADNMAGDEIVITVGRDFAQKYFF